MGLVEKVCEELGIEVGEEWTGNDGKEYKFDSYGNLLRYYEQHDNWYKERYEVARIIKGELKPIWNPREYEKCYIPYPLMCDNASRFVEVPWIGHYNDEWLLENGMVFKTKEEAIKAANKMIKSLEEEQNELERV